MLRRWGACQCQRILWVKASQSHWPTNEAKRPKTRAPYSKPTDMILIYFDDSLWVSFVRCLLSSCRDQVADSLAKEKTWINWKSQISQWKKLGRNHTSAHQKNIPQQGESTKPSFCKVCWNILNIVKFAGLRLCWVRDRCIICLLLLMLLMLLHASTPPSFPFWMVTLFPLHFLVLLLLEMFLQKHRKTKKHW